MTERTRLFSPQRHGGRGDFLTLSRAARDAVAGSRKSDSHTQFLLLLKKIKKVVASRPSRLRGEKKPRALRLCGETCALTLTLLISACAQEPIDEPIEPPQVLTDSIPFIYPIELWDHNIAGQTVLLLRVNPLGQVDSVSIDAGSGYPEFDSAAVQGAQKLRFIAARQGERRIPMWTKVPVRFSRDTANKMGIGGQ